jgi:CheY-like chemotaxis protein
MLVMMEIKLPPQILETLLKSLRIALSIEDSEFREIERRVKVNKFVDAIREAWRSGNPSDEEFNLLKKLQSLYQISDEDNLSITKRVKKEFGLPDETAPILVVDDEEYVLEFISHILRQTYRTVITAKSVEEAEQILSTFTPALILSDVRMPAPGVGGFTFYERIKEGRYGIPLKDVHFILMSAIADDFFVKTAKQLGVQAYLIKPFTREILEDTIKNALLK